MDFSALPAKVPEIDKKLFEMHFTLYRGYVAQVNFLQSMLDDLSLEGAKNQFIFASIKRQYGFEYDGMRLHELYFENLGGKNSYLGIGVVAKRIAQNFGSYDTWKQHMIQTAMTRGTGWAILYFNRMTGAMTNAFIEGHDIGLLASECALVIIDLWEHAYITQFGLDRKKYVEIVIDNIDWKVVETRFNRPCGLQSAGMDPASPKGGTFGGPGSNNL